MKFPVTVQATVRCGSPLLSDWQRDRLNRFYAAREGKLVQITVSESGKPRSPNQNAYYHGVVVRMLADELGYDPEEMHGILKWKFLPRQFVAFGGEQMEVTKSTTKLTTGEFEEYLERIRVFAATELAIRIPLPPGRYSSPSE